MRPDLVAQHSCSPGCAGAQHAVGRRAFSGLGAALTGSLALGAKPAIADPSHASPPADAPWSQSIGAGVVDRPYGRPADTEAGVIRRNVPWLTAGTESSISFSPLQDLHGIITPNGLFFERHHAGRPDVDPDQHRLDDPRPGRAPADPHHEGHRALPVSVSGSISSNARPMAAWSGAPRR